MSAFWAVWAKRRSGATISNKPRQSLMGQAGVALAGCMSAMRWR